MGAQGKRLGADAAQTEPGFPVALWPDGTDLRGVVLPGLSQPRTRRAGRALPGACGKCPQGFCSALLSLLGGGADPADGRRDRS